MTSINGATLARYRPFVSDLQFQCDNGQASPIQGYAGVQINNLHVAQDGMLHASMKAHLSPFPDNYPDHKVPTTAEEGAQLCLAGAASELSSWMNNGLPGVRIAIDTVTVTRGPTSLKEPPENLGKVPGATITIDNGQPTTPSQAVAMLARTFPGSHKLGDCDWHRFDMGGTECMYRVRRYFDVAGDDTVRIAIQARDDAQAAEVGPDVHAKAEQLVRAEFDAFQKELGTALKLDVEHFKYITGHQPQYDDE